MEQPSSVPMPNPNLNSVPNIPKPIVTGLEKVPPIQIKPPEEARIVAPPKPMETLTTPSWEGIPIDTIRYFGVEMGTMTNHEIEQLKDIDKWARKDLPEDTIGNRLQRIRSLESTLGAPSYHETRVQKMWNWVKMSFNIDELRNRQIALQATSNIRDILR